MQKEASVTSFVISLQFLTNFFLLQLKNNIAALYSSRARGTKSFQKDGVQFGWQPIIDQYERDQTRAEQNLQEEFLDSGTALFTETAGLA